MRNSFWSGLQDCFVSYMEREKQLAVLVAKQLYLSSHIIVYEPFMYVPRMANQSECLLRWFLLFLF